MRRLIGVVALTLGLGVLAATSFTPAEAQDKDAKTKKTKEKDRKEAPGAGGTVEVYKAKDGYRFRIKAADGRVLAQASHARDTKDEVHKDLEVVKSIMDKSKPTDVKD